MSANGTKKRTDWRSSHPALQPKAELGPPRLALNRQEAAEAIGISLDSFERHVQGELPCVYVGARRIYPVHVIEAWLEKKATK